MEKDQNQGTLFPELEVEQPKTNVAKKKKTPKQELEQRIKELEKENAMLKQKAEAFDELISSKSLFTTTVVAKSVGKSAIWLNKYLESKRVQFLQGETWVLYSKYQAKGYTQVCFYEYHKQTGAQKAHTYWTAKGILFIRELLKKDGIIE